MYCTVYAEVDVVPISLQYWPPCMQPMGIKDRRLKSLDFLTIGNKDKLTKLTPITQLNLKLKKHSVNNKGDRSIHKCHKKHEISHDLAECG